MREGDRLGTGLYRRCAGAAVFGGPLSIILSITRRGGLWPPAKKLSVSIAAERPQAAPTSAVLTGLSHRDKQNLVFVDRWPCGKHPSGLFLLMLTLVDRFPRAFG